MGIRTRRARLHSRTHIVSFGVVGVFGFFALFAAAISISLGTMVSNWLQDLPDYESADAYLVAEPTQVLASDGTVLAEYYLQNRHSVEQGDVADNVFKATVDVEDERFYKHNGVDPQGIARAIFSQLAGRSEGASTITQQLVRNTVLSNEQFEQSLKRKVREAYIAIQMEKTYTKDQILMMYLNTIYYGHGAYGIEAASTTYFNKSAKDLSLNESATLAGIPNSPSYFDPTVNMEACKQRRNHVLDRMLSMGDITKEECEQTKAEDIQLDLGSFQESSSKSPYFTDYVRELLLKDFDQDLILKGGLKVYTTLDLSWQKAAEDAVSKHLKSLDDDQLQAALTAIDPDTGYVKAMVGGRSYQKSQYNMATQARRQTGSSFKAFTLVAALQDGVNPSVYIDCSSPKQITSTWKVENYGNENMGTITLQQALALSSNTGFAQIAVEIGADKIVTAAHEMGIDVDLPAYPSLTLGTEGVPPIQMAEGFATLATGGVHHDAVAITRIEDRNGNVVYEHKDEGERAIPAEIAQAATQALETVVTSGSGTANIIAQTATYNQPIAGKTGTTEDFRDLWFVGYTPQVSVAVWVGNEDDTPVIINGMHLDSYNSACPIFVRFTNAILQDAAREEFPTTDRQPIYKPDSTWKFARTYTYEYEVKEKKEEEETEEVVTDGTTTDQSNTTNTTPQVPQEGGTVPSDPNGNTVPDNSDQTGGNNPPQENGGA